MSWRTTFMLTGMMLLASFGGSAPAKAATCIWPGGCITIKGIMYPAPCMAGIPGTKIELAKPNCAGRPGTAIYLVVVSPLPTQRWATVVFKGGQFGLAKSKRHVPAMKVIVPVNPFQYGGSCAPSGFCLNPGSGTGTSLYSVYSWTTTRALCGPGPGVWYWDMFPTFQTAGGSLRQGIDIAEFTAICY
jgi:hypothetical protein